MRLNILVYEKGYHFVFFLFCWDGLGKHYVYCDSLIDELSNSCKIQVKTGASRTIGLEGTASRTNFRIYSNYIMFLVYQF